MGLTGNSDETNGYNSVVKNGAKPDANLIKSMVPPIGTILPWAKNLGTTHTPTLPDGWAECDGSVVSDADSPYNGDTLPDLNDNNFLMGAATSGGTGGSNTGATNYGNVGGTTAAGFTDINGTQYNAGGSYDRRPLYYAVVFIIRIK